MKNMIRADSLIPFLNEKNKTDIKYNKESIIERKEVFINKVESVNEEDGTILCVITTSDVDRAGDIVLATGCDTTEFSKIPSVFVNHNYADLPCASCLELIHKDNLIMAKIKFVLSVPSVKEIWERVKAGVMRGVSIGFEAKEVIMRGTKAFEEISKSLNLNKNEIDKLRRVITKWDLFEFSICSIPCNPNCVTKAVEEVKVEVKEEPKVEVKEEVVAPIVAPVLPVVEEKAIVEVKEEPKVEVKEVIVEVKEEPKAEPIEIIPHVKRYIQVIQTPEEQKEYIDMCIKARLRGKTRISIV